MISSTFMGKTWTDPQTDSYGIKPNGAMPPAPLVSEEPDMRPLTPKSDKENSARSIVESRYVSSKLIFLKNDMGSSVEMRRRLLMDLQSMRSLGDFD